ncbi:uncharacterized protein OCT59_023581 [Rhizophagus irregularis]|nr:hypothetical protein OCT59_023581 [Rhizophagus irregularis]
MNIIETEPTTNNIHENIFEEDLSIVINELSKLYFKELNEGKESSVRKQHILDFIKNYKINLQEIIYWLSNNQHDSNSIHLLGYFYYYGIGINLDVQKAIKFFKKAAELGHDAAQYNLANMYIDGVGVDKNYDKAFELCEKLAGKGYSSGINLLGYCYDIGIGTDVNAKVAFDFYLMAANLEYKYAQYNLALMYEKGKGIEKNMEQAIYWYKKSAEQEYHNAKKKLQKLLKK